MACTDKTSGRISLWICLLMIVSFSSVKSVDAANSISQGQVVRRSETILSPRKKFAMGFFVPGNSSNRYLGIWYNNIPEQTVVWVGNRDQPLSGMSTILTISNEGYIVIVDGRVTYRVSENPTSQNASAVLLDSGNLVLRDGNFNTLWQSFDYPSDTLLPGMRIGYNIKTGKSLSLTAWKSAEDPNLEATELKFNPLRLNEVLLTKDSQVVWSSGVWIGDKFSLMPGMISNYVFNYTFFSDASETYFTYSLYDSSILNRFQIVSGQITQMTWLESARTWVLFWIQPRQDCDLYAYCGPFSRCISGSAPSCQCLQGFKPSENWKRKDMSGGCERRVPLGCEDNTSGDGEKDGFLKVGNVGTPLAVNTSKALTAEECKLTCLNDCSCTAYAYNSSRMCNLWGEKLLNIKQLPKGDPNGHMIYIKVAASELQSSGGNRDLLWIIATVVSSAVILLASYFFYRWRRRLKEHEMAQDILLLDVEMNIGTSDKEFSKGDGTGKGKSKDLSLPLFSFISVSAATDNFSVENKLGEGGFGPVYKGKLRNGQEIAVKRLSRQSGQGLEELKNETMLIAKLQHRNLVRVLGCCMEQGEKILIYEYLPNKSLDSFLFDPTRKGQLNWETRVRIIKGISQGLFYIFINIQGCELFTEI